MAMSLGPRGDRPLAEIRVGKDQASAGPALRLALAERLRGRPSEERSVVVVADERLAYAAIGDALRACREAGADEVALAVRSDR